MSLRSILLLLLPLPAFAGPGGDLPSVDDEGAADHLRIWGQVQTWATLVDQDSSDVADPSTYGDPEHDPGFSIPRARLGASGRIASGTDLIQTGYGVGFGVGSPYDGMSISDSDVQVVDAYGELILANDFGPTAVTIGVHRIPFSRELLSSSRDLTFQERPVSSTHLGHSRDAGITLTQGVNIGDDGMAAIRLGAFNGNSSFQFDTDPGLLLAARAELAIGKAYQTFDPDLEPAVGVGANLMNNAQRATSTTRLGGDALVRYKWVTLSGEYLMGTIAPGDSTVVAPPVSQTINQSGLAAQLSFFVPVGDTKGGPEIAGRLSTFDDDSDSDDLGDVQILHAGLNWRNVVPHVDAGAGYIKRMEGGRVELANDTVRMWFQFRPTTRIQVGKES